MRMRREANFASILNKRVEIQWKRWITIRDGVGSEKWNSILFVWSSEGHKNDPYFEVSPVVNSRFYIWHFWEIKWKCISCWVQNNSTNCELVKFKGTDYWHKDDTINLNRTITDLTNYTRVLLIVIGTVPITRPPRWLTIGKNFILTCLVIGTNVMISYTGLVISDNKARVHGSLSIQNKRPRCPNLSSSCTDNEARVM